MWYSKQCRYRKQMKQIIYKNSLSYIVSTEAGWRYDNNKKVFVAL